MIYPEKELSTQQPNHTTTMISQSKHLGVDLQQLVELVKHEVIGKDAEVYMNIILSRQGDLQATAKILHIYGKTGRNKLNGSSTSCDQSHIRHMLKYLSNSESHFVYVA